MAASGLRMDKQEGEQAGRVLHVMFSWVCSYYPHSPKLNLSKDNSQLELLNSSEGYLLFTWISFILFRCLISEIRELLTDSITVHAPLGLEITCLSAYFFDKVIGKKMHLTLFLSALTY